jgi:hypothetical protein
MHEYDFSLLYMIKMLLSSHLTSLVVEHIQMVGSQKNKLSTDWEYQ